MLSLCGGGVGWGGGGGVCKVIFVSNQTAVLRLTLCCVVVGVVTKSNAIQNREVGTNLGTRR